MRGYFLVAIAFDHLDFFPNGLDWWSMRGSLFVTTAEGFFFISGLVLGIVRGAKLVDKPFGDVAKLLLKRGAQLYITTVVLVLLFTFIGWLFYMDNPGLKAGIAPAGSNFFEVLWGTVSFQYFYGWADYLRLYAIFMFISPLAMWLLRNGKWYLMLAGSLFLWLLFPSDPNVPDNVQELLQPLTWQLIFFSGMTVGFYWNSIVAWWRQRSPRQKRSMVIGVLTAAAISFVWTFFVTFGAKYFNLNLFNITQNTEYELYIHFFDKERMPLARFAMFMVWFWAAFYLFRRFESYIVKSLGWLLLPFGTNSLYVYTVQAFIIFFIHLYLQKGSVWFNFIVSVAIIALIRIMIQHKFLMKVIPR